MRATVWMLIVAVPVAADDRVETAEAEIDVLNHLTLAVATMLEGASAASVRSSIVENLRHDPRWTEARKSVDHVVGACSAGADIQAKIEGIQRGVVRARDAHGKKQFFGAVTAAVTLATGGAALPLLAAAPTLLGTADTAGSDVKLVRAEEAWRRTLLEAALGLERAKETVRNKASLSKRLLVSLADARTFARVMRDYRAADEVKVRRQLLKMARATKRFPRLQFTLAMLYAESNPRRSMRHLRRAYEQCGGVLETDHVAAESAFRLGLDALVEAGWSSGKREELLVDAGKWSDRCLDARPKDGRAHVLAAAITAEEDGEFDELVDVCLETLEIDDGDGWSHAVLAMTLARTGRTKEAVENLRQALSRHPMLAPALATSFFGHVKKPDALVRVLAPRIKSEVEQRGGASVPVVTNDGSYPLVDGRVVAGNRASRPFLRLETGDRRAAEGLRHANTRAVFVYAANGFAAAQKQGAPLPALLPMSMPGFQAWPPVNVRVGDARVRAQVVNDGGRLRVYLLRTVQ